MEPVELTSTSFESSLSKGTWFVKFYAPWCGHCNNLAPTWAKLADSTEKDKDLSGVNVAKVNCDEHATICRDNGVRGYPTLILFHEGKKVAGYRQGRDLASLVKFLKGNVLGRTSEGTVQELMADNFDSQTLKINERHFVMFYAPWCVHCQRLKPTWDKLAEHFKGTNVHMSKVDCTKENALCESFNVKGYPTLKLLIGSTVFDYARGGRSLEALSSWIEGKKYEGEPSSQRTIAEPEMSFTEKVLSNPQMLIGIMLVLVFFTLVMIATILCCCTDEEEEMRKMKSDNGKKNQKDEANSQDSSTRAVPSDGTSEIRKRD